MNLFPPPPGSTPSPLQWQFIGSQFFVQPFFVLCWRQLIPPQFLLKTIRSSQKDSSTCYPPPPRWIMIGSSTKTQKRKGSVAYIFCLLFQLSWSDEHSSPRRLLPFHYLKVNRVWFFFFFCSQRWRTGNSRTVWHSWENFSSVEETRAQFRSFKCNYRRAWYNSPERYLWEGLPSATEVEGKFKWGKNFILPNIVWRLDQNWLRWFGQKLLFEGFEEMKSHQPVERILFR